MIDKSMLIGEVLDAHPETAQTFMAFGMHCLGCAMASGESIAEACAVHGVDADAFIKALNEFVESAQ